MNNSTSFFEPNEFPVEFHDVIHNLAKNKNWHIRCLNGLSGGYSGSRLFHIAVHDQVNGAFLGHFVLKLVKPQKIKPKEGEFHEHARNTLPEPFRSQHTLMLTATVHDDLSDTLALVYPIAGNSINEVTPIETLRAAGDLTAAMKDISVALLAEWEKDVPNLQHFHPRLVLAEWLEIDLQETTQLEDFLREHCHIDTDIEGLTINGELLPNPVYFIRHENVWPETRHLGVIRSFLHGDLNLNNILLHFDPKVGEVDKFYFIDFAYFREKAPIFYDLQYLELSYIINRATKISSVSIDEVGKAVLYLTTKIPDKKRIDADFVGWATVIQGMRSTFDRWSRVDNSGLYDDMWGLFHLAGTAAGLSFAHSSELPLEARYLSFLWAAGHLKSYWNHFKLKSNFRSQNLAFEPLKEVSYWESFYLASHRFDPARRYVAVFGPMTEDQRKLEISTLGRIPWSLVIDFDPSTEESGFFSSISGELGTYGRIQRIMINGTSIPFAPDHVSYWLHAQGLSDQPGISASSGAEWRKKYSGIALEILNRFVKASFYPTTVIVFWDDVSFLEPLLFLFEMSLRDFELILVPEVSSRAVLELSEKYPFVELIPIKMDTVAQGLRRFLRGATRIDTTQLLPANDGSIVVVPQSRVQWLEEDVEIVHLNSGQAGLSDERDTFYRGATISWLDLRLGRGITRNKTGKLVRNLDKDLTSRQTTRHNLFHAPGAGGTTIARQAAWALSKRFPTVLLRRISNIKETIVRLEYLYTYTQNSLLVIVENADIDEISFEGLFREILNSRIPVTFLVVSRRIKFSGAETERRLYLDETLDEDELPQFIERYSLLRPARRNALQKLQETDKRLQVPFLIALTAYERDFDRLSVYVEEHLKDVTESAKAILLLTALVHYYTGRAIDVNIFRILVTSNRDSKFAINKYLTDDHLTLLLKEKEEWRPVHYLISEQILQLWLGVTGEHEAVWKQKLPEVAHRFIELLNETMTEGSHPSEPIIELLQALFIDRSWTSLVPVYNEENSYRRPRFSNIIMDIPTEQQQQEVFVHLCQSFPDQGHFLAHLGRLLYSSRTPDYPKAIETCQKAVSIDGKDPLLHHMLGMAQKAFAEARIGYLVSQKNLGQLPTPDGIEEIHELVAQTLQSFDACLAINPNSEHALTTGIQLLVKVIRLGKKLIDPSISFSEFFLIPEAISYLEDRNKAEDYFARLRELYAGRSPSAFLTSSSSLLKSLYGNHPGAIQDLKRLLQRNDVYHPRVRTSIVYNYLDEVNRDWNLLNGGALYDIFHLMQDNINQEVRNDNNIRLWFNAARRLPLVNMSDAIQNLEEWFARGEELEAAYYLYVLNVLRFMDGQSESRQLADFYIERCAEIAKRYRRPRADFSRDMLGDSTGMGRLVNYGELMWDEHNIPKAMPPRQLVRVRGRVREFQSLQSGQLDFRGLKVFFVPRVSKLPSKEEDFSERDISVEVSFLLSFTYEGLRAYDTRRIMKS